jgi:RNA polymerase sigma-70 factor, ECF subfamily
MDESVNRAISCSIDAQSRTLATMHENNHEVMDEDLMLRYARGEPRAFESLYERHKAALYRYLLRLCGEQSADDVFQEVWGRVISSRKRYQVRAKFATFLYRIAHNCAMDQFRLRARHRDNKAESLEERANVLSAPLSARPDQQLAGEQFRIAFQHALALLPDEQRATFVLYEESGLSLEEIGDITGVSMETAKSRLRYAVGKLRKALGSVDNYFDGAVDGESTLSQALDVSDDA